MAQNNSDEEVAMMRIRHAGGRMLAGYMRIFNHMMTTDESQFVLNFNENDLIERQAWLVTATTQIETGDIQVIGGFHFVIDGARAAHIQGVTIDPHHRRSGLMKNLLTSTISSLFELNAIDGVELIVRVLPDGSKNEKAHRLFSGLGLVDQEIGSAQISGTHHDKHLRNTAEADGKSYRYLRMRGNRDDVNRYHENLGGFNYVIEPPRC